MTSSTRATSGTSRTLSHLYGRAGRRARIVHSDGAFMAYGHDGLERLVRPQGAAVRRPGPGSRCYGLRAAAPVA